LISVKEAARLLELSEQQVRNLCRDGAITSQKVGRSWVISDKVIAKYITKAAQQKVLAEDHVNVGVYNSKKPKVLSFFSGAMGLDLGLEKAGFEVILACEFDRSSRQTINTNKPEIALLGDISRYTAEEVMVSAGMKLGDNVDLMVGGPPCQAFSTVGKRRAFNDDRGNVFLKYIDLATTIRPRYFVIENVRGLLSCPLDHRPHQFRGETYPSLVEDEVKGGALNFVIDRLKKSGYSISFNLYSSANFGTPQIRERVIMICSRDGVTVPYLEPTHSENGEFGLEKWNTFRDAVKGLKKKDHRHLNFPEKRLKYYRLLSEGQNWRNLAIDLQKEAMGKSFYSGGGKTGFLRRLAWDRPSPTVVTHPAMPATDLAHPKEDRPLSVQEYKRIQEFPDDWIIAGGLVDQYKQIGNAVPVSLGMAVGKTILNHMANKPIKSYQGFKYSRYKNTDHISWIADFKKAVEKCSSEIKQDEMSF
jgi:DNA (cytosine-5)-methyltransferase 1